MTGYGFGQGCQNPHTNTSNDGRVRLKSPYVRVSTVHTAMHARGVRRSTIPTQHKVHVSPTFSWLSPGQQSGTRCIYVTE